MKKFWGKDFGIIAIAKNYSAEKICIQISNKDKIKQKSDIIQESDLWESAIKNIVEEKTKFGKIGIVYERKNTEANDFCNTLASNKFNYKQKNPRAEKSAKFLSITTQAVMEMANEGLSDTVEFRRMIRKYIKTAKNAKIDSLLFLEGIFAEKTTRNIIAKTAGTQMRTYFITDFASNSKNQNPAKKEFKIKIADDLNFTKKRAEQILQKKLKDSDLSAL
jgi:hypothetical protein